MVGKPVGHAEYYDYLQESGRLATPNPDEQIRMISGLSQVRNIKQGLRRVMTGADGCASAPLFNAAHQGVLDSDKSEIRTVVLLPLSLKGNERHLRRVSP
jgi:hypothetical protein